MNVYKIVSNYFTNKFDIISSYVLYWRSHYKIFKITWAPDLTVIVEVA